ncbi:MAG TPA: TonB family protein [Lentimicrobium sp.]|nr:TonB family protein [Lentimicrobium sp.]
MEPKKSTKADLESKKTYFAEFGFILTLVALLVIFGWKTYDIKEIEIKQTAKPNGPIEIIPLTKQEKPKPPVVVQAPTDLRIVVNTATVEDIGTIDVGIDQKTVIPTYNIPVPKKVEETSIEEEPVLVADVEAEFPGGLNAMYKFLKDNTVYPQLAKEAGITGTVYTSFVVEKDGTITNIRIQRKVGGGCTEEAIRVLQLMPKWKPAWNNGQLVRKVVSLPIKFELL